MSQIISISYVIRKAFLVISSTIFSKALLFFISLLVISALAPSEYASYTIGVTAMWLVVQFLDFGLSETIVRFLGKNLSLKNAENGGHRKIVNYAFLQRKFSFYPMMVLVVFLYFIYLKIGDSRILALAIGILAGLFSLLFNTFMSIFQAESLFRKIALFQLVNAGIALIVVIFFYQERSKDFSTYLMSFVISNFFLVAYLSKSLFININPIEKDTRIDDDVHRDLGEFKKWLTVATIFFGLASRSDVFILSVYRSKDELGVYGAALQIVAPFLLVASSISMVIFPSLSKMDSVQDVADYIKKTMPSLFVLMMVVALLFYLSLIKLSSFLPHSYHGIEFFFPLILVAPLLGIISNHISYFFLYIGKPKIPALIIIFQCLIVLTAQYILIPKIGGLGAIIGSIIGAIISIILHKRAFCSIEYEFNK